MTKKSSRAKQMRGGVRYLESEMVADCRLALRAREAGDDAIRDEAAWRVDCWLIGINRHWDALQEEEAR